MSGKVTKDQWKSSLNHFKDHRASYLTEETLKRGKVLLEEFVKFTEPSGAVLDIGCGSADYGRFCRFKDYVGVDPIAHRTTEFPFVQGVGEHLPFKNGTFDCVVTMATLDHCLDPAQVLAELRRVLKENGRLFVWMQVIRTDARFKTRRMLHYLKTLDFRSLAGSLGANIDALIREDEDIKNYGHVHSFTERSLIDLVSDTFEVAKTEWRNQSVFIVAGRRFH